MWRERLKMGSKTKIDWCDATWNPVTGCLHGCEYCYARRIAERFGAHMGECSTLSESARKPDGSLEIILGEEIKTHILKEPVFPEWHGMIDGACFDSWSDKPNPYPFDFDPTFHIYRLDIPKGWKKPKNIFVCSMADLFGKWVADTWIEMVFRYCQDAPQHRYLFLTKNPDRYLDLDRKGILPREFWYGYSATRNDDLWRFTHADECPCTKLFVSIEPMLEPMNPGFCTHVPADWVIIGAETGNRKGKVIPEKSWIMEIAEECELSGIPVFMKESLRGIMGEDFRQEFPW
jgi:protein gp37